MKISAIICEFNPIHTGHKRLLDYAKSLSDKVVCIMSGNFVQRGMPACADKFDRARHALLCGADMVIELPTIFATASAQDFAFGGVKIARQIGADFLVFGSECGDINQLTNCAKLLDDEHVNQAIRQQLSLGASYPKAVATATNCTLLESPNNTLAIEYIRAINNLKANICPMTILREDNFNKSEGENFASSSMLRNDLTLLSKHSFSFVNGEVDTSVERKYQQFAVHYLSTLQTEDLKNINGVIEGMENKIVSATKIDGYDTMMDQIKSKRYTRARLQRIVLCSILKIEKNQMQLAKSQQIPTKVLAIKQDALGLLERVDNVAHQSTIKADNLYYSLTAKKPLTYLQKI